ncbi:MAG: bifunctional riboflavin kinase/FAD synthetase [Pseudoalteromonas marina]
MQLIRGIHNIKAQDHGCVLTIGNFDGVHKGHQKVIESLVSKAKALSCVPAVLVFEPQPQEVFSPKSAPARLSRLRDKYKLLAALGVERLICIPFTFAFAGQSPEQFIESLLVEKLGIKHLIVGDDFHFGKNRAGNYQMLRQAGKEFGFNVSDTDSCKMLDCRVSSTAIRQALDNNDFAQVENMLGRPYGISGKVFHGDKRGRQLGFPTANVLLKRKKSPLNGVFAVNILTAKGSFKGVANIGDRPTISGVRQQLEVNIFNFNENLYGQAIEVIVKTKLREVIKFDNLDALRQQIFKDVEQAKVYFEKC